MPVSTVRFCPSAPEFSFLFSFVINFPAHYAPDYPFADIGFGTIIAQAQTKAPGYYNGGLILLEVLSLPLMSEHELQQEPPLLPR